MRFAHVDPAGIVSYPRYFEMLNSAVEDWFAQRLGLDFATMHLRHLGVPAVRTSEPDIFRRLVAAKVQQGSISIVAFQACGSRLPRS